MLKSKIIEVHVLRLNAGEEAIAEIIDYCKKNRITAGWINMIGACSEVELYYYNPTSKKYENLQIKDYLEVLPSEGNIGVFENEPILHIHGLFSDNAYGTHGGHVNSLIVSATLEVKIEVYEGTLTRKFDEATCLKLMSLA